MSGRALADADLRHRLFAREVTDDEVDELYSPAVREVSGYFWTPVRVAARAADLFQLHGATRVLDVGSGPGKFCLAAAAAAPTLLFVGVEQRGRLVAAARQSVERLQIANASYVLGDAVALDWSAFDGFYFFNPFGENLFEPGDGPFDHTVELSRRRFYGDVLDAERRLRVARVGTMVITYHGFGGRIPRSYQLVREEVAGSGLLRTWRKARVSVGDEGSWLDRGNGPTEAVQGELIEDFESIL